LKLRCDSTIGLSSKWKITPLAFPGMDPSYVCASEMLTQLFCFTGPREWVLVMDIFEMSSEVASRMMVTEARSRTFDIPGISKTVRDITGDANDFTTNLMDVTHVLYRADSRGYFQS